MSAVAPGDRKVVIGRIAGVYGVKGWVKLVSFTRPIDSLLRYRQWSVGPQGIAMQLLEGKPHGAGLVGRLGDGQGVSIDNRDQAARLVGCEIAVLRSALPPARNGEIYWVDMIGLKVVSTQGEALGIVESIAENGAQDVLSLSDPEYRDEKGNVVPRLIPFVRGPIIESVDLEQGLIVARWSPDW